MDGRRFDRIAVAVGGTAGRRAALQLLGSGFLSILAGWRGPAALAQPACDPPCEEDRGCCGGTCHFLGSEDHCGACDAACAADQNCLECVAYDPEGEEECRASSPADRFRCCPPDQHNSNGVCCEKADPPAVNCCTAADEAAGHCQPACLPLTAIAGQEEPVLVHDAHCGRCGNLCSGGKRCVAGRCTCPPGERECGDGTCIASDRCCTDADCTGGKVCFGETVIPGQGGVCACPSSQRDCNGQCQASHLCCSFADCDGLHCCDGICRQCCNSDDCGGRRCCDGFCGDCCIDFHCHTNEMCCDFVCQPEDEGCFPS